MDKKELEIYKLYQKDPFMWLKDMYGLVPQNKGEEFIKGKMISWQQAEIFWAIKEAVN